MKKKLFLASLSLNALGLSAQEVDTIAQEMNFIYRFLQ